MIKYELEELFNQKLNYKIEIKNNFNLGLKNMVFTPLQKTTNSKTVINNLNYG